MSNIVLNSGAGGATLATDQIAGVDYQIAKIGLGAAGAVTLASGNSGNKDAGTLRVVIATDQVQLTNKLLTTPDLPSGASTAAKQPALGTAGTASADVITVQGIASMTALAVSLTDGADVTLGAKTDAKNAATDATSVTVMQVLKQISASVQAPPSQAVTNAGTFAVQLADGADITLGAKADAKSTATDTTAITIMSVLKQISASVQAPPSQAVTNAGTFAVQLADGADITLGAKADAKSTATDTTAITIMSVLKQISASVQAPPSQAVTNAGTFAAQAVLRPETANGLTTAMFSGSDGSSILVATAQVVKASAGQLYGYYVYNPEAAVTFVHFYNVAAASVTVGTTNPQMTLAIPAGSAANVTIPQGIVFSNAGWSVAATTTAGGNTAPATGASLVVWYA